MTDPRKTGEHKRNTAAVVAANEGICALCNHPGARTGDHIIPVSKWPIGLDGINAVTNLQPAHGARNPCPVCGLHCNQIRGARDLPTERHSRNW